MIKYLSALQDKLVLNSRDNNHVLLIAPRLPEYDRASGDLRLFKLLQVLSANYVLHYFNDGIWERFLNKGDTKYLRDLKALGIKVLSTNREFQSALKKHEYSCVICEFYLMGLRYFDLLRQHAPRAARILDTVDVSFFRERMMAAVLNDGLLMKKAEETYNDELTAIGKADYVWVVSEFDRDIILNEHIGRDKIVIVPNIHVVREHSPPLEERKGKTLIFVGGFLHQPNVDAVKYFCKDIYSLIAPQEPTVEVMIVGDSPPEEIQRMACRNIKVLGYVNDIQALLDTATVSIAPLRYGAGLKGKVGEALASGLPVVTTSVGAQGMGLVSGRDCFIADDPAEFAGSVLKLLHDPVLWRTFSENGRGFMAKHFGYQATRANLLSFMANIVRR